MIEIITHTLTLAFGFFLGATIMGIGATQQYQKGYEDRKREEGFLKYE